MTITVNEIKRSPLKIERLVYSSDSGNRIDVEVYLKPLRAIYKVGREGDKEANIFSDLSDAVKKFNRLEQKNKKCCDTCGVTEDSYCNECEEYNRWFKKKSQ